jgi:exodeoxyribonuclease V gamma subunit
MMRLYSAASARPLSRRLADLLAEVPPDPLAPEWLAVPSDGMRRWLTLELAGYLGASGPGRSDGVAANIERALPGDVRNAVLSIDRAEDEPDPWRIERLVWSVLEVMAQAGDDPELPDALAATGGRSGYTTARRIADLYDRYNLHRPVMIRNWSVGRDVDGTGRPLPDHARWQPRLWRLARERVGEPSPPERLPGLLDRLRDGEARLDLPPRLLFFGFTLLPAGDFLEVIRAVGARHDVHVFLLEPTHLDAGALLRSSPTPTDGGARLRANDPTAALVDQPLLRSWGRLHRETALLLADARSSGVEVLRVGASAPGPPPTLLGRLQHDIRTNAAPTPTLVAEPSDRSVQFHACFGDTRQVEVLRDAVVHLLSTPGSDLVEDDIVVFCPALDRFAPLIEAVFGPPAESAASRSEGWWSGTDHHGAPALRYRLADRSIRTSNPVVSAASALLGLVVGRFDVPAVLEFLALGPVRERFGFDEDSLGVIGEWMEATNVRWGLDPTQRALFGMPRSVTTNTWSAALDRLLIGSAVDDQPLQLAIGGVAPFGVEGGDVEIVGRLAEVMWHLAALAGETSRTHPIATWVDRFRQVCAALLATTSESSWQMEALERILFEVVDDAECGAPTTAELDFSDMRKVLEERLDDRVGRADFFRGGITVTSMTPLRWVPFRVVCLLGMDQAAFGAEGAAGDDLTAMHAQIGDRDPRGEARETLLEAVLAAQDHLVVVREGRDVRTNQPVPRAVVTAELFEAVLAPVAVAGREATAARLEINHPRHPFDERCFEVGRLVEATAWGFDRRGLAGARARRVRAQRRPPFMDGPLGPADTEVIDLADLHRFFADPAGSFFSQRLQARLPRPDDEIPAVLPLTIDGLAGWRVGNRLLEARLAGFGADEWLRHERALGTLPPEALGVSSLSKVEDEVEALVETARHWGMRPGPVEPMSVDAELPDGTRVVGSVPLRLHPTSPGPVRLYYSRFKATHRVAAWLDLMALLTSDGGTPWRSLAVSRPETSGGRTMVTDLVASVDIARGHRGAGEALAVAVDCYRRGMTEPLPLFPGFSYQVYRGKATTSSWRGRNVPMDGDQPAVRLAFGDRDFDAVMHMEARPTDPPGPNGRVWRFAAYLYRMIDTSAATAKPPRREDAPVGPGPVG